jgi:hypothetical protein
MGVSGLLVVCCGFICDFEGSFDILSWHVVGSSVILGAASRLG